MSIRTEDLYSPLIAANAIPPRSALVTPDLYPQDIKKPESITSFIQRVARLYEVSNNDVIDGYILPRTNLNYGRRFLHARKGAYSIDGAGIYAEEFATGLSSLMPPESQAYYSSFMFLRSLLGWRYRGLSAGKLKWCPLCWREQEKNGEDIRRLLSWTVDINTTCSNHKIDLVTRCPKCNRDNPVISASSELGVCVHCGASLYKEDAAISSSSSFEAIWVAQAIDDLIASRKEFSAIDLTQRWQHFIALAADQYPSEKEAERKLGLSVTLFRRWRSRNHPNFPELMHFLYKTDIFPSAALLSLTSPLLFGGIESERIHTVYADKPDQIDKHNLARCLNKSDLSVHGLARLLHVSEGNLRHRLPLLVNRIAGISKENSLLLRKRREEQLFEFALKLIEKAEQNDQALTNEQLRNLCRHLPGFKRLSQRSLRKYLSKRSKERKKLK